MENNKSVTAVEWLYNNLKSHFEHDGDLLEVVQMSFNQAKEMEKEQIIETYIAGSFTGCGCYDYMGKEDGELYYNETFKSE